MPITAQLIFLVIRFLNVYRYILLARVIFSWIIRDPSNPIFNALVVLTEPLLGPIRDLLNRFIKGPLDLSPIIAFLIIDMLMRLLFSIL